MRKEYAISLAVVGLVATVAVLAVQSFTPSGVQLHSVEHEFQKFVSAHGRSYKSKEEYERRLNIFRQNFEEISRYNAQNDVTPQGVTKFADWSLEEKRSLLGYVPSEEPLHAHHTVILDSASNGPIDWRSRGVFNPVRDQGLGGRSQCGSCWAFSSVAAVESHYAIKHNQLPDLSEQQLVDCATPYGAYGCRGGFYQAGFNYLKDYGAEYGPSYPYVGADQQCRYNAQQVQVRISGFSAVGNDIGSLKAALEQRGPMGITVAAGNNAFWNYQPNTIITGGCGYQPDHAVLAVGWATSGSYEYIIFRNSWGQSWGNGGYGYILAQAGVCALVHDQPMFPTL